MQAGDLRSRLGFYSLGSTGDIYGNTQSGYGVDPDFEVRGNIRPRLGGESVMAARLTGTNYVNITVRRSAQTAAVDETWKIRDERSGDEFNITSLIDPYQDNTGHSDWVEILCVRSGVNYGTRPAGAGADTQAKRMAAIDCALPWRRIMPIADGTIDAADREIAARLYTI